MIHKKITKRLLHWSAFSFFGKRFTIRFIVGAKFHYGPRNTPNVLEYFIGTRRRTSLVNLFFLITQLRKTLFLVYLNSYHRGMTVVSGAGLQRYTGIGARCFYFFSPWRAGFLTNFTTLLRHAVVDKTLNRVMPRHVPLEALHVKRVPQLPTYSIALHLQHWCCNESSSLRIPHTITINPDLPVGPYHPTCTLAFNNSPVPSAIIMLLTRDTILSAKMDDKIFFDKSIYQSQYKLRLRHSLKQQRIPKKLERRKKLRKINEKRKNKHRFLRNCFRKRRRFIFSKHRFMVMKRAFPVVYHSHKPLSFSALGTTLRLQQKAGSTAQKFHKFSSRVKYFALRRDYSVIFSRFMRLYTMVRKKNRLRRRMFAKAAFDSRKPEKRRKKLK